MLFFKTNLFILIIIIIIIVILTNIKFSRKKKIIENYKNDIYYVNNLPNSLNAADLLSKIISTLEYLTNKIIDEYNNEKNTNDEEFIKYIKVINEKFPNIIIKENALNNNYTSYSVNKGEEIVLCIRDKNTKELHDYNDLLYIAIHELSHIGCPEYGHTDIFFKINYYLLKKAIKYNLYKYVDYSKVNKPYCGIKLTSTIL